MASVFGHGFTSCLIYTVSDPIKYRKKLLILGILCSILPDSDILGFNFGIAYESIWGHRGFTHSICFAILLSLIISFMFHRKEKKNVFFPLYYFVCTLSHGVLDAMTTGGRGVAFLAPFSSERFFFPIRFIEVSPLDPADFWSEWGIRVVLSELVWIGIPGLLILLLLRIGRGRFSQFN